MTDRLDVIRQLSADAEAALDEALRLAFAEIDTLHQRVEIAEQVKDAVLSARQRVRDSFGHRDDNGQCQCVYCTRDVEGLIEHAADYELQWFLAMQERDAALQRARLAEQALANTEAERDRSVTP